MRRFSPWAKTSDAASLGVLRKGPTSPGSRQRALGLAGRGNTTSSPIVARFRLGAHSRFRRLSAVRAEESAESGRPTWKQCHMVGGAFAFDKLFYPGGRPGCSGIFSPSCGARNYVFPCDNNSLWRRKVPRLMRILRLRQNVANRYFARLVVGIRIQ